MLPLKQRLTKSDRAYLAGIFDGEGCVGYYKRRGSRTKYSYVSMVLITQSDFRLMLWLEEKIGFGSVTSRAGKKHFEYHWQDNKKSDVVEFLEAIEPYLLLKREQARVLLKHLAAEGTEPFKKGSVTPDVLAKREEVYTELRRLKTCNMLTVH
jgi:hypothetical protein